MYIAVSLQIQLIFIATFNHGGNHFELFVGIKKMPGMSRNNNAIA